MKSGFTLIELSIVLVIIGLIVGGILTGRDLIDAASVRAEISQIEKYRTAINTFRGKYGYLPGDIPDPAASSFGFQSRGNFGGEGDGNGMLEGNCSNTNGGETGIRNGCGELAVLWEDLSTAGLIDTGISGFDKSGTNYPYTKGPTTLGSWTTFTSTPNLYQWLPTAKINSNGNFVYAYSLSGTNYLSVSSVTLLEWDVETTANPGLSVQQAYNIDSKTDDGLPMSGAVTPAYVNKLISAGNCVFAAGNGQRGASTAFDATLEYCKPTTSATTVLSTNCYDNNGVAGVQKYSLSQNAAQTNCALSFRF